MNKANSYIASESTQSHAEEAGVSICTHALFGNTSSVEKLLRKGISPDTSEYNGSTSLHHAAAQQHYTLAKLLLKYGASPNTQDESGETPLHCAVATCDNHMIELLLKYKANPNHCSQKTGRSPLHVAVLTGSEVSVKLLLSHGGNPTLQDSLHKSAFDLSPTAAISVLLANSSQSSTNKLPLKLSEVQQGKFYYWLEKAGLESYYELLIDHGFGSLEELVEKTRSPVPLTTQELEFMGIKKPGHRYKLLIKLDEEARIGKRIKHLAVYKDETGCCAKELLVHEISLLAWLEVGGLLNIHAYLAEAGYDMELVLIQGQSAYSFSHTVLKHELKILDQSLRERFLRHLRNTLTNQHKMPFSLYFNQRSACDECNLL